MSGCGVNRKATLSIENVCKHQRALCKCLGGAHEIFARNSISVTIGPIIYLVTQRDTWSRSSLVHLQLARECTRRFFLLFCWSVSNYWESIHDKQIKLTDLDSRSDDGGGGMRRSSEVGGEGGLRALRLQRVSKWDSRWVNEFDIALFVLQDIAKTRLNK